MKKISHKFWGFVTLLTLQAQGIALGSELHGIIYIEGRTSRILESRTVGEGETVDATVWSKTSNFYYGWQEEGAFLQNGEPVRFNVEQSGYLELTGSWVEGNVIFPANIRVFSLEPVRPWKDTSNPHRQGDKRFHHSSHGHSITA